MIGDAVQLTMREMRRQVLSPRLNGILFVIGLVLATLGPFGTDETLLPVPRAFYWLAVSFVTYYAAAGSGVFVLTLTEKHVSSRLVRVGLASAVQALAVALTTMIILISAFGTETAFDKSVLARASGSTLAISFLVSVAVLLIGRMDERLTPVRPPPEEPAKGPKLLTRLEFAKRGTLVSLSVEDHYVKVTTAKGRSLILLRLSDAIAETEPVDGLQIHRSHWVATDGIADIVRDGKKVVVHTIAGDQLPVSRTYLPQLRERALLV